MVAFNYLSIVPEPNAAAAAAGELTSVIHVHPSGNEMFGFLCELYWPFVDSYWVAAAALFSLQPSRSLVERLLVERMQWFAEKLYSERIVTFYDCCSKDSLRLAITLFRQWNMIRVNEAAAIELTDRYKDKRMLLDIVEQLTLYRSPHNQYAGIESLASRLGVPFLAKL
jgi:hypothetical protein